MVGKAWLVLLAYNVFVFLAFGWDKRKARRGRWRTPEATLLGMTALMGGPGALAGMLVWRHKSRKPRFALGVPLLSAMQVLAVWWGNRRGFW